GPNQVFKHLFVAWLEGIVTDHAGLNFHSAINFHAHHARPRVALCCQLPEAMLKLVHLFFDFGPLLYHACNLTQFLEHNHSSIPSPTDSVSIDWLAPDGTAPKPSSTWSS